LAPNTVYRVTVRAKNIRAPHFDEKTNIPMERYSCHIDFRTLPKGDPFYILFHLVENLIIVFTKLFMILEIGFLIEE
jgi:hypothetical protein